MGLDIVIKKLSNSQSLLEFRCGKEVMYLGLPGEGDNHLIGKRSLVKSECVKLMALIGHDIFMSEQENKNA